MKNPQLMVKKLTKNRVHVVVVGDTYQGPKRGYRLLPGQPHRGLRRTEAQALAASWSEQQILSFAGRKIGSYVSPRVRKALQPLGEEIAGGMLSKRPTVSEYAPPAVPTNGHEKPKPESRVPTTIAVLDKTDVAAELIVRRRGALKLISEIDQQLGELIDDRAVEVIRRGMATPLASLN